MEACFIKAIYSLKKFRALTRYIVENFYIKTYVNVYLLVCHLPFIAKVQNSYAAHKIFMPTRLVQRFFETSLLYKGEPQVSLVQKLRAMNRQIIFSVSGTFVPSCLGLICEKLLLIV